MKKKEFNMYLQLLKLGNIESNCYFPLNVEISKRLV
jgi:hypothetical protein